MWVRKITIVGNGKGVILPRPVIAALGWERGDYMHIRMVSNTALMMEKFDITRAAARKVQAEEELPTIQYD